MSRVAAMDVVEAAARQFTMTPAHLRGDARDQFVCRARNLTCKAIRQLAPHVSVPAIGELMNGRDHTTILTNVERIEVAMRADASLAAAYRRLVGAAVAPAVARTEAQIAEAEAALDALRAERAALLSHAQPGA